MLTIGGFRRQGVASRVAEEFLSSGFARTLARRRPLFAVRGTGMPFPGRHLSARRVVPMAGFSVEFSDRREYVPGDDPRLIDWRALARTGRPYVKEYLAETSVRITIVLDCSRSMGYESEFGATASKLDYGVSLAAALACVAFGRHDRVGLALVEENVRAFAKPKSGKRNLLKLIGMLDNVRAEHPGDICSAVEHAATLTRRRGLTIVISDLLDTRIPTDRESAAVESHVGRFVESVRQLKSRKQDVLVLHVLDPAERSFPFDSYALFEEPESGARFEVSPRRTRSRYIALMNRLVREYEYSLGLYGCRYHLADTSASFSSVLSALLSGRGRCRVVSG